MNGMVFVTLLCCQLLRYVLTMACECVSCLSRFLCRLWCQCMWCSLCCCMLFVSYVWVLFVVL